MAVTKGREQARRVFASYCHKNNAVGGAQPMSNDGKQYVGNHFMVCRYADNVDGLQQADRCVNFKRFIDEVGEHCLVPFCKDDIKVVDGSDGRMCSVGNDTYYDYVSLKKMLNTFGTFVDFGICKDTKVMGKGCNALFVRDVDGNEGFILALRPKKD